MRAFALSVLCFSLLGSAAYAQSSGQPAEERAVKPAPTSAPVAADDIDKLKFRVIGPAVSGGRVSAVAGSDRDPMVYYVGGAGGGVFKSTNGGTSFTSVWDKEPVGAIGAIAVAPSDDKIVWVGTGEANPRNDVSFGDGMWRSTNAGKSWTHVGLSNTSQIGRILVDPRNPKVAIVAALGSPWKDTEDRGVYRTADGGATWTKTLYIGPQSGASDLAWDPKHPDTIYAGMWQYHRDPWLLTSGGEADGVYRSRDNGRTWTKLAGNGLPSGLMGRIGVAVAYNHPNLVWAEIQSKSGVIWRSTDGGDRWQLMTADTLPGQRPFYFSHLAVDPTNPKRVVSLSMYIVDSKNSGRTWKKLATNVHVDNHTLWWSRDGKRMIEGNDGGFIISNDGGSTWNWPANIPLAQTYHVGYGAQDIYSICTGLQDNSSWCAPSDTKNGIGVLSRDWTSIAGGDGVWAMPDPLDPTLFWTDTQDGSLSIYDSKAKQSIDVSPYPNDAFTNLKGISDNKYRFDWNSPLAFDPSDGHIAYFGGNVVFRTSDRGRTWTPISPDLTRNEKDHQQVSGGPITLDVSGAEFYDTILDVAPSPLDPKTMWVGTDDGLVQLTRDGGATWKAVTPEGLPKYGRVEAVEPGRFAAGTAFFNFDRHDSGDNAPYVFMTEDYGATWKSIVSNLPANYPVRTVRQDPKNANLLYVGTEQGVFYSLDRGGSWTRLHANLPAVPYYDIRVQPAHNDLLLATHGRGIYVLDDLTPLQHLADARAAGTFLYPIRPGYKYAAWAPIEAWDNASEPNNIFIGDNPAQGVTIAFYQKKKAQSRPSLEIVDANGHVVRRIMGTHETAEGAKKPNISNDVGINRVVWDGTADAPEKWNGASFQFRGPDSGPDVVPGNYTARLHVDGKTMSAPFAYRNDPANPFTPAQMADRYAFLTKLYAAFSNVDKALNRIDVERRALRGKNDEASIAKRGQLDALLATLTSNPQHDEDTISRPDKIRERLLGLAGAIGSSFQPPDAAHLADMQVIMGVYDADMAQARTVLGS
jgi:photosystem II stability/assembly factor-like uncharacterized protein